MLLMDLSSVAAGLDKQTLMELLTADDLIVFSEMQVWAEPGLRVRPTHIMQSKSSLSGVMVPSVAQEPASNLCAL